MEQGFEIGVGLASVSRETRSRLQILATNVLRWNKSINLVSADDAADIWQRHILDSLRLVGLVPPQSRSAADLGSGGGFPGLVLAIATGLPFNLVEADKRKAAFLVQAAQLTGAPVTVHACRIESCGLANMDVVTSRALAPMARLLAYAEPILAEDGVCLFLKGENVSAEMEAASSAWDARVTRTATKGRADSEILVIDRISRV